MSTNTEPRIYVACLASYNAGILHGAWIDAAQDPDNISAEIVRRVLLTSPVPNVNRCKDCLQVLPAPACEVAADQTHTPVASSEEYAIHDYEGFQGLKLGEYEPIERAAMLAELVTEHPGPVIQYAIEAMGGNPDGHDIARWIRDNYRGEYDSEKDFIYEWSDDMGLTEGWPEDAIRYFDWDAYTHDRFLDSFVAVNDKAGTVYVFNNR